MILAGWADLWDARSAEISGDLGRKRGAIVYDYEAAVLGEQRLAFTGAAVVDAAGGLLDALYCDLLEEALGAVPAAQEAPGLDAHLGEHLADGEDGA